MPKLSETTEVTIPVKNLLGILAFTTVATTAYFRSPQSPPQLTLRLRSASHLLSIELT